MSYLFLKIGLLLIIIGLSLFLLIVIYKKSVSFNVLLITSFCCMIFGYCAYTEVMSCVAVVYEIEKLDKHHSVAIFGDYYNYEDSLNKVSVIRVAHGEKYVFNRSSEYAVYYPIAYGQADADTNAIKLIDPYKVTKIPRIGIDYYFGDVPESIYVDEKWQGEVRYCLDWVSNWLKSSELN